MCAKPGRCDFVTDVAAGYPLHVIMEIMGVPEEDEPRMLRLTQELFAPQDPDTARALSALSPEQLTQLIQATIEDFSSYFRGLSAERRAHPREDLATQIANAKVDGEPISDIGAMGYYIIVATAGHDTTSSSTAGAIWALAENPGEFAKVKADPSLIPGLVDEAIRWMTPVKHFMRSATADTELAGRAIAKGDWLMLCYASGNRDEEVFEDPYVFHVDRKPNRHLAFAAGAHAWRASLPRPASRQDGNADTLRRTSSTFEVPRSRRRAKTDPGPLRQRPQNRADKIRTGVRPPHPR